jgi:membrane-bound lytic murein transglycosylase A
MMQRTIAFLCLALLLLGAGCGPETPRPLPVPEEPTYVPVDRDDAEDLAALLSPGSQGLCSWSDLRPGIEQNLRYIRTRPGDAVCVRQPGLLLTWSQLEASVSELLATLDELDGDPELLAERFQWFKLEPGTLLTGYYEPTSIRSTAFPTTSRSSTWAASILAGPGRSWSTGWTATGSSRTTTARPSTAPARWTGRAAR